NGQPVAYTEGTLFGSPKTDCPTDILHIPVMMNQAYSDFNYILYLPHVVNPLIKESYNCTTRFGNVLPAQTKIAILLDVSGSNAGMDWQKYLKEHFPLKDLLGAQNTVDLYYFNDALSEKIPLTEEILQKGLTVIPFGKTNRLKALQSLPPEYDVTLMVTDDSSFDDIKKETSFRLQGQFPLYLIHPSGVFPAYRDDLTYQITMSGGGVFASPKEALRQLAIKKLLKDKQLELMANQTFSDSIIIGVDEQGTWFVSKRSATETNLFPALKLARLRPDDDIGKVAAGVFIRYLTFTSISVDEIHKIATDASIVSPYSSFIALVNDWQKSQLEQAKKQNDRFQADFDTGVAPLANPMGANALTIGAVPEPEEWLLMIVGVMLLLFFYRHRLLKFVR
ncbi:MAG: hypothetical protein Q8R07_01560, partial [Candidatus Uhrbacteria bacterium]|nr:hypothetical protein [Candidatus Uhrbacteria bacterium]